MWIGQPVTDGHLKSRVLTLISKPQQKSSADDNREEVKRTPTSRRSLTCVSFYIAMGVGLLGYLEQFQLLCTLFIFGEIKRGICLPAT